MSHLPDVGGLTDDAIKVGLPRAARTLLGVSYLGIALLVTFWLKFTLGVSTCRPSVPWR
jgi:hypothetical protein